MRRRLFQRERDLIVDEILNRIIGVSRSERRQVINAYAQQRGLSARLLYRLTQEQRALAYQRDPRADLGARKVVVPHLDNMFRLTVESDFTAPMVLETAELGLVPHSQTLHPSNRSAW